MSGSTQLDDCGTGCEALGHDIEVIANWNGLVESFDLFLILGRTGTVSYTCGAPGTYRVSPAWYGPGVLQMVVSERVSDHAHKPQHFSNVFIESK